MEWINYILHKGSATLFFNKVFLSLFWDIDFVCGLVYFFYIFFLIIIFTYIYIYICIIVLLLFIVLVIYYIYFLCTGIMVILVICDIFFCNISIAFVSIYYYFNIGFIFDWLKLQFIYLFILNKLHLKLTEVFGFGR